MSSCHVLGCNASFSTVPELEEHLRGIHATSGTQTLPHDLIHSGETKAALKFPAPCPLCDQSLGSIKEYQHHVGRHQEGLALFALPNTEEEEDDTGNQDFDEVCNTYIAELCIGFPLLHSFNIQCRYPFT